MFLKDFHCLRCGTRQTAKITNRRCPGCNSLLVADYDYEKIKEFLTRQDLLTRTPTIWRYKEMLPIRDESILVTRGEGLSPLLPLKKTGKRLRLPGLFFKDESLMPCSTFKSRGVAVAVSRALEAGANTVAVRADQSAALAWASYCAAAGLKAVIYSPISNISERNALAIAYTGARLYLYEDDGIEAEKQIEASAAKYGWMHLAPFYDPYCLEGEKTLAFEIAENFKWQMPSVIVSTCNTTGVMLGIYRGLRELQRLGWIPLKLPRLVAVQDETYAPLVQAWQDRRTEILPPRVSDSLAVCQLDERAERAEVDNQAASIVLDGIYKSLGCAVAVNAKEVAQAKALLASDEGVLTSDNGAAALAAVTRLRQESWIKPSEWVVMLGPEGGMEVFESEEYQPAATGQISGSLSKFLLSREADILPDILN